MLLFQAVLLGLPSGLKLACLLFVPALALVIRRKWRLAAASREEVKRLVILAAQEAVNAEIEAVNEYRTRVEYETSPASAVAPGPKGKPMCAVCYKPTTTRCSRCKAVKYCSGKCQIIHWRQGHKEECRPPLPDTKPKDKATSSKLSTGQVDNSSLSESSSFTTDDNSIRAHMERTGSSGLRCSSSIHINENISKVEPIDDLLMTSGSSVSPSSSSSDSTTSSCSTFTAPSETTDDASFESSPARREHSCDTADVAYTTESKTSEQKLTRSSSSACSETYSSDNGIALNKLNGVSDCGTKEAECQSGRSEEPNFSNVDDFTIPNSKSVNVERQFEMADDHVPRDTDSNKPEVSTTEFILHRHNGPTTKPFTNSSIRTVSSLPAISNRSPVYRSVQPKGSLPKSRSLSTKGFDVSVPVVRRGTIDALPQPQEVDSLSFSASADEKSDGGCRTSVSVTMPSKVTNHAVVHTRLTGMTNSISKVVQQFKPSKLPKNCSQEAHGSESAGKQIPQMHFSYDTFVKLYNGEVEMRPFGLMNCGNSCYANVVLQCLVFTRPLSSYLLQGLHSKSCAKSNWCLTCELEILVSRAKQGESVLSPAGIMSQVHNIGAHLGPGREEDAHEFLRSAVDTMQSASCKTRGADSPIRLSAEASLMQLIFGGYIRSKIKCMNCQSNSVRNERMLDLTVGIPGDVRTLQEALFRFTATEVLDGENRYKCSRCKSYQKAKKRLKVLEAPNILTIALKRFQSGKFGKLNKAVVFPEQLNLADYMTSSSRNSDRSPIYQLYAVVVHLDIMNAAFSGHYVCYVRNASGKWFKIDDSTVKPVEIEKVLSKTAYMLFYARQSPRNATAAPPRPKSKSGEDLPAAPSGPRRRKDPGRFSDDSDGGASSLFSRSSSEGSGAASCSTESARYSSSTEGPDWIFGDGSSVLWGSPAGFSDDSDGGGGWWRHRSPAEAQFPDSPESGYSASELSSSSGHDDGFPARGLSYDGETGPAAAGAGAAAFLDSDDLGSRHFRKLTLHRSSSSSLSGGGDPSTYKSVLPSRSAREWATQTRF